MGKEVPFFKSLVFVAFALPVLLSKCAFGRNLTQLLIIALIVAAYPSVVSATTLVAQPITPIAPTSPATLTASWTGGTSPYSVNWYSASSIADPAVCSGTLQASYTGITSTTNSYAVNPGTTTYYCYIVSSNDLQTNTSIIANSFNLAASTAEAYGIAISPDGSYAYVVDKKNNEIAIIDTSTLTETNLISGFNAPYDVAISPDGSYAYVTDSGNSVVSIVSTATNTITGQITGFSTPFGIAFTPDGALAYVVNTNAKSVNVITTASNSITSTIARWTGSPYPYSIAISPDGSYGYITTTSPANSMAILHTATNTVTAAAVNGLGTAHGVAFLPNGNNALVVNNGNKDLGIVETATNAITANVPLFIGPENIAVSPDGSYALVSDAGKIVRQIDVYDKVKLYVTPTVTISSPSNAIVDVGQYETFTATASAGTAPYTYNILVVNSVTTGTIAYNSLDTGDSSTTNTFTFQTVSADTFNSPEEANVILTDARPTTVNSVYSSTFTINPTLIPGAITPGSSKIDSGQSITLTAHPSGGTAPYSYQWYTANSITGPATCTPSEAISGATASTYSASPTTTNSYVYQVTDSATTNAVACSFTQVLSSITGGLKSPFGVAFSPDGSYAYVLNNGANNVVIVNTATNAVTGSITSGFSGPTGVAFSPGGSYAYVLNNGAASNVVIVNTATNTVTGAITGGIVGADGVAISPDGSYAYVVNFNANNVVIINTATNAVTGSITSGFNHPEGVAFSPSGTYAYVLNNGANNVVIVNTATNAVTGSITSGFGLPVGAGFSPDGSYAYVVNQNPYNVVIINTATNTVTGAITNGISYPDGVAISPGGSYAYVTDFAKNEVLIINTKMENITVNPALAVPTLTSSPSLPSTQDAGNTITFTSTWSGGTSGYTVNYLITNTITGALVANYLTANTFTSNAFAWTIPSADAGNTVQANVIITDSASSPETTNSVKTGTLTITSSSYAPPSTPTLSSCPSSSKLDVGQSVSCTATVSGGTSPYTYNWLISNSVTGAITANMLFNSVSSTSNTFTYTTLSADTSNSPEEFNVIITDAHPTTVNSIYSGNFYIAAALTTPTLTASNTPSVDTGQYELFSAGWTGGTSTYTANYQVFNTITGTLVANALYTGLSGTSNTFLWQVPAADAGNTISANVFITDSASTPVTVNSAKIATITINSALNPSITVSNTLIDYGQTEAVTANAGGGTSSYTYNFLMVNSITDTVLANVLYTGVAGTSNTATFTLSSTYAGNTIAFNVIVTDSASTPVTKASAYTDIGYNSLPTAGAITPASPTIDNGQSVTLTSHPSGGTTPYSYNWYTIAGSTAPTCTSSNTISGATSSTYSASPTSTNSYAYQITDSATTPVSVCSSGDTVTVNPAFTTPTLTASNTPSVDTGQYELFSAGWTGGTSTYTANYQVFNTITGTLVANALYTGLSGTSNTFLWQVPAADAGNTISANVFITDSASTPVTVNSAKIATITINSALGIPTLTSSPTLPSTQNAGNTITFDSSWTGGTSTYTVNYIVVNTITGSLVTNMLFTGITGTSNSFAWTIPSADVGNTLQANAIVTDSAATKESTNSVKSGTLTITASLACSASITNPSNAIADIGQYESFTATQTNCVSPFTYNILVVNSVTTGTITHNDLLTGQTANSVTYTFQTTSTDTSNSPEKANVVITDSGTNTVTSGYSSTITINSALSTPTISPSNPTIGTGQSTTLTASWSGGTPSYKVNWYSGPSTNTCAQDSSNVIASYSGIATASNSLSVSPLATNGYCVGVTDSASTQETLLSSVDIVTVTSGSGGGGGGGGGGPSNRMITISDNIASVNTSLAPIFTVSINGVAKGYYHSSTPQQFYTTSPSINISFACNATIGRSIYTFQGTIYGIGAGLQCNKQYNTYTSSLEGIYSLYAASTSTTTSTTTSTSTTIPPTITSAPPTTVMPAGNYISTAIGSANSPALFNASQYRMLILVRPALPASQNITVRVSNVTANATAPPNYTKIFVFYLNASVLSKPSINVTIEYNCSFNPGVVPFALENGTWHQIYNAVLYQNPCSAEFSAPNKHVIGLFARIKVAQQSTPPAWQEEAAAIAAAAIILVSVYYILRRRRKKAQKDLG